MRVDKSSAIMKTYYFAATGCDLASSPIGTRPVALIYFEASVGKAVPDVEARAGAAVARERSFQFAPIRGFVN